MATDALQLFDARRSKWCNPDTGELTREAQMFVRSIWLRVGGAIGPSTNDLATAQFEDAGIAEQLAMIESLADGGRQSPPQIEAQEVIDPQEVIQDLLAELDDIRRQVYGLLQDPIQSSDYLSLSTLGAGVAAFLAAPTSANLATAVTNETGTGLLVFSDSPTLVTPAIGKATGTTLVLSSTATASALIPSGSSVPANGVYLPAANSVGIASNSTLAVKVDSSQNVIVGGTQAAAKLHVNANGTGSDVSSFSGALLHISQADSTSGGMVLDGFGAAATISMRRAAGTAASKSAVQSTQNILVLDAYGYGSTAYSTSRGRIAIAAAQAWTDAAQGTYFTVNTTAIGSTSLTERLRVDDAGQLLVQTVGKGLSIKEGSNAKQGTATLVAGTVTVSNTSVTASSRIFISRSTAGGTLGHLSYTKVAGTSFTVTSTSATDTSSFDYLITEPS